MSTTLPTVALEETMSKLERALLAPVVAGELKDWVSDVEEAARTFATDWTRHLHSTAHLEYRQIAKNDAELLPTVTKMIETDQQLLHALAGFQEDLHGLAKQAEEVGWQEGKLSGRQKKFEETGVQLITRIKKQQLAGATWLSEAFYRDRGTKD